MSTTYTFSTYTCEKFTTADGSFTWTPGTGITTYDVLIVAGGGGGGLQGNGGGGGGAGGCQWLTAQSCTPGVGISGSVGAGGTAGTSGGGPTPGGDGTASVFASTTSTGGGGAGAGSSGSGANNGRAGGSGGGGSGATAGNTATGGAGTAGQGSNGGSSFAIGSPAQSRAGGGGGGKGAVGTTATNKHGGDGGTGFDASALLGTTVGEAGWFASGGGGGTNDSIANGAVVGVGPIGGGSDGIPTQTGPASAAAGQAETGGGGGGGSGNQNGSATAWFPGAGGSGVIIVRYATPAPNIPTFVFQTDQSTTMLELSWLPPASGPTPTSYQVRLDFGSPVTATSPHQFTGLTPATSYTMEVRAVGTGGSSAWVTVVGDTDDNPPGVPTSVVGTPLAVTAELEWNNPATGGAFTSFDVRLDGGTPVTGVSSPYVFTGLTPETSYDLEVRAVGPGGASSWVLVTVTTTEDVAYRARVTLGDHVWDVTYGEGCDYGPTLPLSVGWEIPESADFFPAQASPMTAAFGLVVESVADVADIALMDPALIEIFVPASDPDAFIYFPGVVAQLDATVGQGGRNLLQVFVTDPIYALSVVQVGLTAYDEESEFQRVESIAADAEIDTDWAGLSLGASGTLAATNDGAATDALSAIQQTLRDVSDLNDSFGSDIYGRVVYAYDPTLETLYLRVLNRIYFEWPALLGDDGTLQLNEGVDGALDGCKVETAGNWTRLPMDRPTWVIVDGIPFGTEDKRSDVLIRSTPYVDVFPDNSGTANARDRLGHVLLPPDPDPVAWRANTFRYLSHLDPEPVRGWWGLAEPVTSEAYVSMPWADGGIRAVFVSPVAPELTLDGRTWLSGTLTGARWTLPPGGKHYVDVTLRPELYEVDPFRITDGPLEWADVDGALTWADMDPLLAWRDLRLVAGS